MSENWAQAKDRLRQQAAASAKAAEKGRWLPLGGKASKMNEPLYVGNRRAASAAYDRLQNIREQRAEDDQVRYERGPMGVTRKRN
jgi:hypothetical protein